MRYVVQMIKARFSVILFFAIENRVGSGNIIANFPPIGVHTQAPNAWSEAGSVDIEEGRFSQSNIVQQQASLSLTSQYCAINRNTIFDRLVPRSRQTANYRLYFYLTGEGTQQGRGNSWAQNKPTVSSLCQVVFA